MNQLSPLTLASISFNKAQNDAMARLSGRCETVTAFRCRACGEIYEWRDEAEGCCPPQVKATDPNARMRCPVCGSFHETPQEAVGCCLWRDLGPMDRERVAEALHLGRSWSEALAVVGVVGVVL